MSLGGTAAHQSARRIHEGTAMLWHMGEQNFSLRRNDLFSNDTKTLRVQVPNYKLSTRSQNYDSEHRILDTLWFGTLDP